MKRRMAVAMATLMAVAGNPNGAKAEKPDPPQDGSAVETVAKEIAVDMGKESIGVLSDGAKKTGEEMTRDAFRRGHGPAFSDEQARRLADKGAQATRAGEILEKGGKAISHAEWISKTAGRAYEKDYSGAAIEGVNGFSRTVATGAMAKKAGVASGVWIAGKAGAKFGALGGPVGALGGFVIGVGVGYVGGKIWDWTIGSGAQALDQKIGDWEARRKYLGPGPGGGQDPASGATTTPGVGLPHPDGGTDGGGSGTGKLRRFR